MGPLRTALTILTAAVAAASCLTVQTANDYQHDFDEAVRRIDATYAYFHAKATRWHDVPALYASDLRAVRSRDEFILLLERVIDELYDPHAHLDTHLEGSSRLVPSGADLWAEWRDGDATITQVRDDSDASRTGLRAGAVVSAINGVAIAEAVEARMGRSYDHATADARDWALRAVLTGRYNSPRRLELREGATTRMVELPAGNRFTTRQAAPLESSEIRPGVGYVRLHNSLGDDTSVAALDRALERLRRTRGLIIDLRDTPGGGNTGVAEGILGRFVERALPYQKHALPSADRTAALGRNWLEHVSPRGPFTYAPPVVVLVGRWTGSMGEGLAMGFDATGAGTVVGTAMAGLVGATTRIVLPRTGIGINLPFERLFHVNGTPREDYQPSVRVDVAQTTAGRDPFLDAALEVLRRSNP